MADSRDHLGTDSCLAQACVDSEERGSGGSAVASSQAAAIPYRKGADGAVEVLLVTSRRRARWVLPKGKVKSGILPRRAAEQEAFEEAGVVGKAASSIATYCQSKARRGGGHDVISVMAFPLAVTEELNSWPEMTQRQRQWLCVAAAINQVQDDELKRVLRQFEQSWSGRPG